MNQLPITLTKRGKDFAIITKASDLKVATSAKVATNIINKVATSPKDEVALKPEISDIKKEGYHYVSFLGKYVKD